jgi:hypothetical protein
MSHILCVFDALLVHIWFMVYALMVQVEIQVGAWLMHSLMVQVEVQVVAWLMHLIMVHVDYSLFGTGCYRLVGCRLVV